MALHRALTRVYVNDAIHDAGDIFEYDGKPGKNTELVGAKDAKARAQQEADAVPLKVGMERGIDETGSGALVKAHEVVSQSIKSQEQLKAEAKGLKAPEQSAVEADNPSSDWTKDELVAYARNNQVDTDSSMTKDEILAAIKKSKKK